MKKGKIVAMIMITAGLLSGCVDHMPDMTQEQTDLIAEYAADLLLKYSPNLKNRLTDVEEITEEKTTEQITEETDSEEALQEETQTQETVKADTTEAETQSAENEQEDIDAIDLADLYDLLDISISYSDFDVCSMYPKNATGFAVSASKGHRLLVVHFDLKNHSDSSVQCNLFDKNPNIKADVGGKSYKVMSTLLENDMTVFIDELDAGKQMDLVAVFEIDEDIDTIDSFVLKIEDKEYVVE